ncbi:D-alanyl-D-alanine carboxypeptidase/D-alanyl-D-alanine-endopeptidase [Phycicoccus flavus]|uniref:D-alanyl-D-alanine carboxypeptidase/D-alanyl-D-alanine-endopeptidase n=1 Tax=Phycicoccus flavus TaxID=2502783 RepID=A0A8T6R7G0_9MICO|nr:D-alanyl-D-alanine carboxypeptidase [Phycicoccus flavus]NHA69682.1 D-alanyl-D-alanine carboxypeptidase/D-alanyl-D-alanine-endopeptidase [Phycicoccus flavus]
MRRVMLAGTLAVGLVAAGGYVTADVLDLVPGVLTRAAPTPRPTPAATPQDPGADPVPAILPTAAAVPDPALTDTGADAPVPTRAGLQRAVRRATTDDALDDGVGLTVRDGVTGRELYAVAGRTPRVPASTAKLLSALAVADTLDLDGRIPTAVVRAPGTPDLVLVARGDMLLADDAGRPSAVVGRAGLGDLADQVVRALRDAGDARQRDFTLRLDLSFARGPRIPPTWNPHDVRDGFAGPVAMTGLASRQAAVLDPAPDRPEVVVARALRDLLADRGVTVRLRPERTWARAAPEGADELGVVESATYGRLLDHALEVSDNTLAESLVRQAAATTGAPTSGRTATGDFVRSRLRADGIPVPGLRLKDASGLSPGQRVAPDTLGAVLARAVDGGSAPLARVVAGLPVSGLEGTLSARFTEDATRDVLGVPRAKTGTLRQGSSLAGTTVTADGRPLLFAVQVDGYPQTYDGTLRARAALDGVVAALTRCGCR